MKKILWLVLASFFTVSAVALAEYSSGVSINYGSGGTTVQNAIRYLDDEFDDVYTRLNEVFRLQAAASAPSADNDDYDVWMDTSTTPPSLKYHLSGSWEALSSAAAFASNVTMDDAFMEYTHNVILSRQSSDYLQVVASAAEPATLGVGSGLMYQNTATATVQFPGATASGIYDIIAAQSGATTNFSLAKYATGTHPLGAGERLIGWAKFDTSANDFTWIRSVEVPEAPDAEMPYGWFHAHNTHDNQTIADATWTRADLDVEVDDFDDTFASERWTPTRPGRYMIFGSCEFPATTTYARTGLAIKRNGNFLVRKWDVADQIHFSAVVESAAGSAYFELFCYQDNAGSAAAALQSSEDYSTALWGYYLGRTY